MTPHNTNWTNLGRPDQNSLLVHNLAKVQATKQCSRKNRRPAANSDTLENRRKTLNPRGPLFLLRIPQERPLYMFIYVFGYIVWAILIRNVSIIEHTCVIGDVTIARLSR